MKMIKVNKYYINNINKNSYVILYYFYYVFILLIS